MTARSPLRALARRVVKSGLGCGAALLLACSGGNDTPVLELETALACDSPASCISAGVESYEIAGVRVLHKPLPGHPLVAAQLSSPADNLSGTQFWAESLALALLQRRGSARFDSATWSAELLRHGANVTGTRAVDYSHIDLIAPLPSWRAVWDLVAESVSQPNLDESTLAFYRGQALRVLSSERDDPQNAAAIDAFSRQFQGDVQNLARESQTALTTLSMQDLSRAWHTLFEGRRLLVTVVGDIDRQALGQAVNWLARSLYLDAPPSFQQQTSSAQAQPELAVLPYPDSPNWYIESYFRGPPADSAEYAAFSLGLEVLDQRLFRELRDVRGLAYTTGARARFYRNSFGQFWLASAAPREALPVAGQIILDLETLGPDEEELAGARARLATGLYLSADDPDGLASTLSDWELTAGAHTNVEDYLNTLEQTQPAQVAAALSTYLRDVRTTAAGGGSELVPSDLNVLFASP